MSRCFEINIIHVPVSYNFNLNSSHRLNLQPPMQDKLLKIKTDCKQIEHESDTIVIGYKAKILYKSFQIVTEKLR